MQRGIGDAVQTPFGKGVVREVRNNGRLLVEVQGRALLVHDTEVRTLDERARRARPSASSAAAPLRQVDARHPRQAPAEVDLHGLTVEDALARAGQALSDAALAGLPELRFIHGKSGGRIRAALHRWLRDISSVRGFRADPRNDGVTIVLL